MKPHVDGLHGDLQLFGETISDMNKANTAIENLRLSIVVPTLNEEAVIEQCVHRAFALNPVEVVVADGQSRDKTAKLAEKSGAKVVLCQLGRGIQLNAGAAAASGDVILFLHADCWLEPVAMRQMAEALADPAIVGGAFRQRIEHEGRLFRWLEWGNSARVRFRKLPFGDQGIFLRHDVFQAVGRFPEVRLMEDVLLMAELRHHRMPIRLLPGPLHVDPRRWLKHGIVRQTCRNWTLLAGLKLGISPDRLAEYYLPHKE